MFERVKSEIPAAPDDVLIRHQINATTIDFTTDTNIFIEEVPINVQPNVVQYPFILQHGGRPNRLMVVYDPASLVVLRTGSTAASACGYRTSFQLSNGS